MTQTNGMNGANGHKQYPPEERISRKKRIQDVRDCEARKKSGQGIFDVQLDNETAAALTWIVTGKDEEPAKLKHDPETRRGLGQFLKYALSRFQSWCQSEEVKKIIAEQIETRIFENLKKAVENSNSNTPHRRYVIQTDGSCIEIWPAGMYMDIISGTEKWFDETTIKRSPEQWTDHCKSMSKIEPDKPWMDICQPGMSAKLS